jgi:hypothetical protein
MMAGKAREEGVQELQEFGSSGAQIDNAGLRSYQGGEYAFFLLFSTPLQPELPPSLAHRAAMLQKQKLRRASLNS